MVRCIICDILCSHFKAVIAELQAKVIKTHPFKFTERSIRVFSIHVLYIVLLW